MAHRATESGDREAALLVERVASSQPFRRAARLRAFLLYVSKQALQNPQVVIHEQEIGAAVFGRPDTYDTGSDNIVRVNATELRKRLEQYFATEGVDEPVVLEIPRGSYSPVFRPRDVIEPEPELEPEPEPEEVVAPARVRRVGPWQAATAILLILCGFMLWQIRSLSRQIEPWTGQPAVRAFWASFFESGNRTDLVLADTSFALAEDILGRPIALADYLNYSYKRLAESPALSPDRRADLGFVLERNNGSIGDFRVAQQILSLNRNISLKFAREFTAEAAVHDSLILIGSRKSNPWVDLFGDKLQLSFEYDSALHRPYVVNRTPAKGEQAVYPAQGANYTPGTGYASIAYLPEGSRKTLILQGTDSQATDAAGEFITSEASLRMLEARLPKGPIPPFEILLLTSQLSGTPVHAEILVLKTH